MPYEKMDLTFLGISRRRHRDGTAISCGKPRKRDGPTEKAKQEPIQKNL